MDKLAFKKFLSLPVAAHETMQGGIAPLSELMEMPASEETDKLSLVLWRSVSSGLVHAVPFPQKQMGDLDTFVEVMLELCTKCEFPFKPARIECNDQTLVEGLKKLFSESGIEVAFVTKMSAWNEVLQDFKQSLDSAAFSSPSLLDAGCSEQQIREFADAAAAFYRTKLWDLLEDTDLIKIETPKPPRCMKHTVVLGAGSQTYGLGFYDNEEDHYDLMAQRVDPQKMNLCSLTFDGPTDSPPGDVKLWNELDLPLETGDAYPSIGFFAVEEARFPTPKELDFATIVLKALAATSEEELDSGRWTKWIKFMGKRKKCVFSIPDLLDPPDHKEWIRRGKMPEPRGHEQHFKRIQEFIDQQDSEMDLEELNEAINAKFTGPMDNFTRPTDTPHQRAEALCQEAVETFGRRRIQLAKQAIAEDPNHVEANLLLAESTRNAERAIEMFQHAKEIGKTQLGSAMKEAVGHFWDCSETRPFMRACHGLANALQRAGQTSDAIFEYQEMLRLNPNDNQGVRYELIPLLVAHDREPDAIGLLDAYQEETAFWAYMKSLVEFRRNGNSPAAKKAMRSAFKANQYVVTVMQSPEPPRFPESYSLGSPEEAMICIDEMAKAWEESEGYVDWMFQQYFTWEKEQAKKLRDQKRRQRKNPSTRT